MRIFYILLAFAILQLALADDAIEYEGVRVDMSALTFNRDILHCIIPALNRTKNNTFTNLAEYGGWGSHLSLTNIKIQYGRIEENRFDMLKFEFQAPIYTLKSLDSCVNFEITFDYSLTWLIIPISSGKGAASVANLAKKVLVFFNETEPDVQLPHPWDVLNVRLASGFITPTEWAESLLQTGFIPEFHKAVDNAMFDFGHEVLKAYTKIEDVFSDDYDLIFYNTIIDVKPTHNNSFFSIGFDTNATVNGYLVRDFYRRMTVPTVYSSADFNLCLAAQLIPDTMDVLGRGGYYDGEVLPDMWGFETGTVKELFPILPSLRERHTGDEEFRIDCQASQFYTVNDLGQRYERSPLRLRFQNPMHCHIEIKHSVESVLTVQLFFRFTYQMKEDKQTLSAFISNSELFGFTSEPELPEERREILASHLQVYSALFNGTTLLSPGLKILPTRVNEMNYTGYTYEGEEMCFDYMEKKEGNTA